MPLNSARCRSPAPALHDIGSKASLDEVDRRYPRVAPPSPPPHAGKANSFWRRPISGQHNVGCDHEPKRVVTYKRHVDEYGNYCERGDNKQITCTLKMLNIADAFYQLRTSFNSCSFTICKIVCCVFDVTRAPPYPPPHAGLGRGPGGGVYFVCSPPRRPKA